AGRPLLDVPGDRGGRLPRARPARDRRRRPVAASPPGVIDRATLLKQAVVAAAAPRDFLKPHPRWRFVFVNHATTNPFFVPALYGMSDACSLLGTSYQWTGSARSNVGEMVAAMRHAVRTGADGIALSIIDPRAFNAPTQEALRR